MISIKVGDLVIYAAKAEPPGPITDPYATFEEIPVGTVGLVVKVQPSLWNGVWVDVLFGDAIRTVNSSRLKRCDVSKSG